MQSFYDERFERDMGCTEADWQRWLPDAIGEHHWKRQERTVGVRMIRDKLVIDTGVWPWGRPKRAVISYTGIRKGFAGVRFIERSQQEFDANERFLNLNKP